MSRRLQKLPREKCGYINFVSIRTLLEGKFFCEEDRCSLVSCALACHVLPRQFVPACHLPPVPNSPLSLGLLPVSPPAPSSLHSQLWWRVVFAKWPASCWTARGDALGCPWLLEFSVLYLLGVSIKLEEVIL